MFITSPIVLSGARAPNLVCFVFWCVVPAARPTCLPYHCCFRLRPATTYDTSLFLSFFLLPLSYPSPSGLFVRTAFVYRIIAKSILLHFCCCCIIVLVSRTQPSLRYLAHRISGASHICRLRKFARGACSAKRRESSATTTICTRRLLCLCSRAFSPGIALLILFGVQFPDII